jgi:hypothetical protein
VNYRTLNEFLSLRGSDFLVTNHLGTYKPSVETVGSSRIYNVSDGSLLYGSTQKNII